MFDLELSTLFVDLGLVLAALVLAIPIGLERHAANRPVGMRTFPIVSIACCAFVIVGLRAFPDDANAQARLVQGLMTGIGFIGGGAILKDTGGHVQGIATAASLWNTAAIGASVGFQRFEIAVVLALVNVLILRLGATPKPHPDEDGDWEDDG